MYCAYPTYIMRGRWASAAIGAGIARNRANREMEDQEEAHQREIDRLKAEQQREIERLKGGHQSKPQETSNQEDVTQKLQKLADLKKQGILTDEEFQKLKMELLAKI